MVELVHEIPPTLMHSLRYSEGVRVALLSMKQFELFGKDHAKWHDVNTPKLL